MKCKICGNNMSQWSNDPIWRCAFCEKPKIKKLEITPEETHVIMQHPNFRYFIKEVLSFFKKSGGRNYVEMTVVDINMGEFTVTIQKKTGKTPAEINSELKKEIKKLKEKQND